MYHFIVTEPTKEDNI